MEKARFGHRLVLGGARSGKTRHALALAESTGATRVYIATAEAGDAEMAERIAHHQAERGPGWRTLETPLDLSHAIATTTDADVILVDCLTLWLSNIFFAKRDPVSETEDLVSALQAQPIPCILVSNEIGLGLVPETPLGRRFRDEQGRLNQRIAAAVPHVDFVAAGLALSLKG
ncbi:bifunctional adenosylcobinamide kinase/adenosylcobinamide-phosphate guanylyltransferase [Rhodobacteraceae bacterium DSL-40]|uniref:bifunctional adenosylcobinamide kinase/adenosylcobinamide-phosphate guanylyltransferase n=1 Tax=Amaricoccus sp. B4 TaxID=3368557 RepID=UPI000DACD2C7